MEYQVLVTLNTSVSAMSPCHCVNSSGPTRLCACKVVPVLSIGFSEDLPEQLKCLEKGGEIDTLHKLTSRNAVRLIRKGHSKGFNKEYNFRLPANNDRGQRRFSAIEPNPDTGNDRGSAAAEPPPAAEAGPQLVIPPVTYPPLTYPGTR